MKTDLLASKYYFPARRLDLVPRPHLVASLEAGLSRKLTLVSAPAGFGKTTLLSEWIRDHGHPAAWLSLDKNDNDPTRFLTYLIAALQRIQPDFGADTQAALEESLSPHFEALLTRLIREIGGLPGKSIIVLDDYHLISSKAVHDVINFLIEYLPPTVHLVISGRSDPPLPVSRLRVQGEVNEMRTQELRFKNYEIASFLNDLMGFELSTDGIAALETRTEGWIASLKLAALSMHGRDDWPEFIAEFSGSNRYVIDYLVDEVMARQPIEVQTFLRRTSILERFCVSLGEYVAGGSGEIDIIDYLDRSNLFLIPLDDHRLWYRYHHLFADFLHQRLLESERDRIPELHSRASQWYENEGLVDEAIQHALAAGDLESATRLVDGIAPDLLARREPYKLVNLVEQLPPDMCQGYPMLCICYAWAWSFMGQPEMVEPALRVVEANQVKGTGAPNPGFVTVVRAYSANQQGDLLKSSHLTEQALEEMSTAPPTRITLIFRGAAVIWLGVNHRMLGDLDKARQLFKEAATLNQKAGNYYAALASYEQLAELAEIRGQLQQAIDFYQSGLKLAQSWTDERGYRRGYLVAAAGLHLGLGTMLYQLNDLAGAATHIQRGDDLLELGGHWGRVDSYKKLAYLKQANGEIEACAELLSKALAIYETVTVRQSTSSSIPSLVQLAILLSRLRPEMAHLLTDASQRVENKGVHADDEVDFSSHEGYPREIFYSDLAGLLIATDRASEALPLLGRLLQAAIAMERHGDEIRYLVQIALAQHALGETLPALDSLGKALNMAQPQGYVRLFLDEGQPMAELLYLATSHNIAPGYASQLLASFPSTILSSVPGDQEPAVHPQGLVDPLSEREIEVLNLISEGCKYNEIAERLVVSINTVRHHTRNIYNKLAANNRTQAIARAKELDIL